MLHTVNLLLRPPLKFLKTSQNNMSLADLPITMFCGLTSSPYLMTHSSKTSIEVNGSLAGKKDGDGPKSKQGWKHSGLLRQSDSLCRSKVCSSELSSPVRLPEDFRWAFSRRVYLTKQALVNTICGRSSCTAGSQGAQ